MCGSNCNCGKGGMCNVMHVVKILLVIGGVNWGLIGVSMLLGKEPAWNVVNMLLGSWPMVEGIVYLLVGVAAVMKLFGCKCKKCMSGVCNHGVEGSKPEGSA